MPSRFWRIALGSNDGRTTAGSSAGSASDGAAARCRRLRRRSIGRRPERWSRCRRRTRRAGQGQREPTSRPVAMWSSCMVVPPGRRDAQHGRGGRRDDGRRRSAQPDASAVGRTWRSGQAGTAPRSNQIRSPENRSVAGSHGNRMSTSRATAQPGRRDAGPRPLVRAGQRRDLEHALRPDDDLASGRRRCPGRPRTAPCRTGARRRGPPSAVRSRRSRRRSPGSAWRSGRRCRGGPRRSSGGPTGA